VCSPWRSAGSIGDSLRRFSQAGSTTLRPGAVVDASVWVALHHRGDRFHSRCAEWLERLLIEGGPLVAPTLLEVEAAAALRRLTGVQQLVEEVLARSSARAFLELVPLTPPRAHRVAALAISTGVRGADAVYLELARERNDVLVTLDRRQLERGAGVAAVEEPSR